MNYLKFTLGVLIVLSASRFVPHPPNFTSLIALSFYLPAFFGRKSIGVLVIAYALTDLIIGFHNTILFTWGSVILIGLMSHYFRTNTKNRIFGSFLAAIVFFIITNFGVWCLGGYGYNFNGLLLCYFLALPFFGYSVLSTLIFSVTIETLYFFWQKKIRQTI